MTERELVIEYQRLSAVAKSKRKEVDRAIKELVEAEKRQEQIGCAIDVARKERTP